MVRSKGLQVQDDLVHELISLRRGRGLHRTDVHKRIGPAVARWADIPPGCGGAEVRRLVHQAIGRFTEDDLPPDDRRMVLAALGLDRELHSATLTRRTSLLAADRRLSERTIRRRVDDAFAKLAHVITKQVDSDDPERGWVVCRLRALVLLDREAPEVVEERTIVATRDDLAHIAVRFSMPRRSHGPGLDREVDAEIQYGAVIVATKRLGANHFLYLLALPRALARNETHTYAIVFKARDGRSIADHYVFTPLVSCRLFETRVRFAATRRPVAVWRTDQALSDADVLPHDGQPDGPLLALDGANEAAATFDHPEQARTYGICWRFGSD